MQSEDFDRGTSRHVTVFEQTKDWKDNEEGDRYIVHGHDLDTRYMLDDEEAGEVVVQRRRPSTVRKLVEERGGWNDAGHEEFDEQHKLPIDEVLD